MLKEKIKKFTSSEGDNKKKIENIVFLVIILIITIVVINAILKTDKASSKNENTTSTYKTLADTQSVTGTGNSNDGDMQKELEAILSTIKGVGKVNVFLSYSESSKTVAMYDEKTVVSSTEESDSSRRT